MIDLEFFIGTYSPIPYLDSQGIQCYALDIPYLCRFVILALTVFFLIKGVMRLTSIFR